ncbi:4-hydroxythreonine-4-phosphate dehydrogenase PdxA [Hydromonas duriensis]|uniref:4-hydroxythreonine-4-phosphate dehydrogenase n=1 Tax=Hydromonas duriensis TaxID=1527608 RepID=A0A4R6Y972_9BURK|nr:4-hydroxythreonine-4-phosphate dehydrogenase PdxA [Hydromonas duriensis]TDR32001.1 4-hydroxythreonine-4-phosphate dehydrogenase [Hydromonas duriensis]
MNATPSLPLAITTGEPAGIGAEISLRAASEWLNRPSQNNHSQTPVVLVGDLDFLTQTAHDLSLSLQLRRYDPLNAATPNTLDVVHIPLHAPVTLGQLNVANAPYVLKLLDTAVMGITKQFFSGMVTAPVHKGIINEAGIAFTGHTEYLAEMTETEQVVMMLAGGDLRVALATTHLPLSQVPAAITQPSLAKTLSILLNDLTSKFNLASPRVLVTGLNPHAGENGHMGREEIEVITPVIQQFQAQGHDVRGPYPADTLFQPRYLQDADAVLAMYHDQGLPVLKYASFGQGINITLGLPLIRTSVDHGTALDLAGKNLAHSGSMLAAIQCAHTMVCARSNTQGNI